MPSRESLLFKLAFLAVLFFISGLCVTSSSSSSFKALAQPSSSGRSHEDLEHSSQRQLEREAVVAAAGGANESTSIVPVNIFAGAPVDVSTVNISVAVLPGAAQVVPGAPSAGHGLFFALQINGPANLQWNRATVQFARDLMLSAPHAGSSVFAPSRMLETASWQVDVSGVNATLLTVALHVGVCMDPPRRSTSDGQRALQLQVTVPPSATNPPLTEMMHVGGGGSGGSAAAAPLLLELPAQASSSVELARKIIGAVFFVLIFLIIVFIFLQEGGASAAAELLWTLQTMLAVADSPCARHSFYSFSTLTFWMLRTAIDARSEIAAIAHTFLILGGVGLSLFMAAKAKTPQGGLRHPRLGLFFVCVFLLGGVQCSMLLTVGGVPDLKISKDVSGRAIGIVTLLLQLIVAVAFCWSGIGSPILSTLHLERASAAPSVPSGSSAGSPTTPPSTAAATPAAAGPATFFFDRIWRPITSARRSSPIAGIFAPIAHLPRRLSSLANFLPFFLSLTAHLIVAILASVDPSNIGGCVATLTACISAHLFFAVYIAAGTDPCRSRAWAACVALSHFGRAIWCVGALLHLDCSGNVADIDVMATVVSAVGLACALGAAVIALLAVKKEMVLTSNKLKKKVAAAGGSSSPGGGDGGGSPTIALGGDDVGGKNDANPTITVTNASLGALSPEDLDRKAAAILDSSTAPVAQSPNTSSAKVKGRPRKPLPPQADGTGERPSSPLSGGLFSSPTFMSVLSDDAAYLSGSNNNNSITKKDPLLGHRAAAGPITAALGIHGNNNNTNSAAEMIALRGQTASTMSSSNALLREQQQHASADQTRPRGISIESKLSSGSGGHDGPTGKRSPSSSLGPGMTVAHCTRCGLPARPSPTGGQTICGSCKTAIAEEAQNRVTAPSGWELPSQSRATGGREGGGGSPNGGASSVVLPSWEANQHHSGGGTGILQLPAWGGSGSSQQQQQQQQPQQRPVQPLSQPPGVPAAQQQQHQQSVQPDEYDFL